MNICFVNVIQYMVNSTHVDYYFCSRCSFFVHKHSNMYSFFHYFNLDEIRSIVAIFTLIVRGWRLKIYPISEWIRRNLGAKSYELINILEPKHMNGSVYIYFLPVLDVIHIKTCEITKNNSFITIWTSQVLNKFHMIFIGWFYPRNANFTVTIWNDSFVATVFIYWTKWNGISFSDADSI